MVPRVQLRLSAPGINSLTLSQFALKAIMVMCVTLTICFWWLGSNIHEQIDDIENQAFMIGANTRQVVSEAQANGLDLSDQAIQKIPQQIAFVKQVRERVGFSWTQLLTDLESAVPSELMMSTVSLNEKTNTVVLNGTTPSLRKLNQFIHQLETHEAFRQVILTQHAKKKMKDATRQPYIVFSMTVSYDPNHHSKTIKS